MEVDAYTLRQYVMRDVLGIFPSTRHLIVGIESRPEDHVTPLMSEAK